MKQPRVSRVIAAKFLVVLAVLTLNAHTSLACPSPPPPVQDLKLPTPSFYKSRLDPKLKAAIHKAAVRPLKAYLQFVTSQADRSLTAGDDLARADAGRCAGEWLAAWAKGEAWLGEMATRQSEYQRKWDLVGLAIAYLKVKPYVSLQHRAAIEPWLDHIATAARAFFNDHRHRRNNHWYWLGLGLAATGWATNNEQHWAEARRIMQDAAHDIRANGTLPLELDRGSRALHYHCFSAEPLVLLAELGAARGEDWYSLGDGALHRLVELTVAGLRDSALFNRLAGQLQTPPRNTWRTLPLYQQRFPWRVSLKGLPDVRTQHARLGGNVLLLLRWMATEPIAGSALASPVPSAPSEG